MKKSIIILLLLVVYIVWTFILQNAADALTKRITLSRRRKLFEAARENGCAAEAVKGLTYNKNNKNTMIGTNGKPGYPASDPKTPGVYCAIYHYSVDGKKYALEVAFHERKMKKAERTLQSSALSRERNIPPKINLYYPPGRPDKAMLPPDEKWEMAIEETKSATRFVVSIIFFTLAVVLPLVLIVWYLYG